MKNKKIIFKQVKNYVVKRSGTHGSADYYWNDEDGFKKDLVSATRYTEKEGVYKLGEILRNNQIVCELVEFPDHYVSPVKAGTVVKNNKLVEMVTVVPETEDELLLLTSPDGNRHLSIQEFLEEIRDGFIDVIWDPETQKTPESSMYYLNTYGFIEKFNL